MKIFFKIFFVGKDLSLIRFVLYDFSTIVGFSQFEVWAELGFTSRSICLLNNHPSTLIFYIIMRRKYERKAWWFSRMYFQTNILMSSLVTLIITGMKFKKSKASYQFQHFEKNGAKLSQA